MESKKPSVIDPLHVPGQEEKEKGLAQQGMWMCGSLKITFSSHSQTIVREAAVQTGADIHPESHRMDHTAGTRALVSCSGLLPCLPPHSPRTDLK